MKKILLIEDEHYLQKSFKEFFKDKKYKIISAFDGETGLDFAKKEIPDLILLDIILPKINGLDVLKKIKETPETKDIPVIILTNLESVKNVEQAIELGAMTYLIKAQYSLEELEEKIKKIIEL